MESTDLTVWGVGTSRTMRVHWMVLELGLEYECHPIQSRTGETHTDEFKRLNPRHKIPVLCHGSLVVTESAAIIQYLSETFADSTKIHVPNDAVSRAKLNEWCYFIISELDAGSLYVIRRHEGLKQMYGAAPNAVESARSSFLHNLAAMATRIGGDNTYLCGEQLSAADILLMTSLDWAVACGIAVPETVSRYRQRVALRPAYQAALKKNFVTY